MIVSSNAFVANLEASLLSWQQHSVPNVLKWPNQPQLQSLQRTNSDCKMEQYSRFEIERPHAQIDLLSMTDSTWTISKQMQDLNLNQILDGIFCTLFCKLSGLSILQQHNQGRKAHHWRCIAGCTGTAQQPECGFQSNPCPCRVTCPQQVSWYCWYMVGHGGWRGWTALHCQLLAYISLAQTHIPGSYHCTPDLSYMEQ